MSPAISDKHVAKSGTLSTTAPINLAVLKGSAMTLEQINSRAQIDDVLVRYTTALDQKDWGLLNEVFASNATADFSQAGGPADPVRGREAIAEVINQTLGTLVTQHVASNFVVSLSGDDAEVVSYVMAQHYRSADGAEFVLHGRYTDIFRREAEGWRIASRVLEPIYTTGDPGVFGA